MILFCGLVFVALFAVAFILDQQYQHGLSFAFTIASMVMAVAFLSAIAVDSAQPLPRKVESVVQLGPNVRIEAQRLMPKGARTFFEWPFLGTSVEYRLFVGGAEQLLTTEDAEKMLFMTGPAGKDLLWRVRHIPTTK